MSEQENNQPQPTQTETITNFEQQLQECQTQKDAWKDQYLRTAAEFENFKKRSEKERGLWITSAQTSLLLDLLTIVDDFDRAFSQPTNDAKQMLAGFELIYKSLQKLLEKYGVEEMKNTIAFDPTLHEAISQVESPDHKTDDVVQVLQKGYMFKGNVLRPAKVSVAK